MDEEEGEAKRTSHTFLLNLPLIFADSESCGFTVMTHVEKKLSLQCPLNGIKATVDESIPPCRIYGCLGWYSITTLVNWALVLVALAPVPTIALMSQRLKHTSIRTLGSFAVSPSSSHYKMPPHHRFAYSHAAPPATKD